MYLHSTHARVGRNFYHQILKSGTVVVSTDTEDVKYEIEKGDVKQVTIYGNNKYGYSSPRYRTEIEYGVAKRVYVDGKLQERIDYKAGTNCTKSPSYYSRNKSVDVSYVAFQYPALKQDMKVTAYKKGDYTHRIVVRLKGSKRVILSAYTGKSGFTMLYPDGKKFMEVKGKVSMATIARKFNGRSWQRDIMEAGYKKNDQMLDILSNLTTGRSMEATMWNRDGSIRTHVIRKEGQWDGAMRVNNEDVFYIKGVMIDAKLYHAKPEDIDPNIILQEPNAQVRSMLIAKVGLERMIQKCKAKTIDSEGDYALYEITIPAQEKLNASTTTWDRRDAVIRMLKVKCPSTGTFYTLRVPPNISKVEDARQWTFGGSRQEDGQIIGKLDFVEET